MKQCIKCLKNLTLDNFPLRKSEGKLRNSCKKCYASGRSKQISKLNYPISVSKKECTVCLTIKSAKEFHTDCKRPDGLFPRCKECRKIDTTKHYEKNKESIKKTTNKYYYANKTKAMACCLKYQKNKVKTDPFYKLSRNLRNRLYYALKNTDWKKDTHFTKYIGCDRETLLNQLESQFQPGMEWSNYGEWHIDHRIPLASAKTEKELYSLCHYTNLQPLWALDNIKKADKI